MNQGLHKHYINLHIMYIEPNKQLSNKSFDKMTTNNNWRTTCQNQEIIK